MIKSTLTSKMSETTITNEKIELSLIYVQENIPNRDRQKTETSQGYIDLLLSITNTKEGLIHPIIVRADHNGKYELFAGYRRYLVYSNMSGSGEEKYQRIPAKIWPPETSTEEMLLMTIHENKARADLSSMESIEAKVALVPFFLNCGKHGQYEHNRKKGYDILKLYNSFLRGEGINFEKMETIIKLTNCKNADEQLDKFFKSIGERVRTFYDKASVLMNASPQLRYLLQKKRISLRHAKALRTMVSDTDRSEILKRIIGTKVSYKEIDKLIRESNIRNNPLKARDALVKYSKDIFFMMENQKKDLTEEQSKNIKFYLQRIEAKLLEER